MNRGVFMDVYVVLQPIFALNTQVYAYEMLYRKDHLVKLSSKEEEVSPQHLVEIIFTYGINKLAGEKQAFIKFTKNLIELEVASLLKPEDIVIDVFEPIEATVDTLRKFKVLHDNGYKIAFGDFIFQDEYASFFQFANFIKINYENMSQQIALGIRKYADSPIRIMSEKIDTPESFESAKSLGCQYFQGEFFSKSQEIPLKDIPAVKFNLLDLLSLVNESNLDFEKISEIISRDVSLSYKLLRLVNSVAFGFRNKVDSIKLAIVALGGTELKKWVSVFTIDKLSQDKPDELVRSSLVRAKFSEQLSLKTSLKPRSSDLFLSGLFSMLDVIMGRPLPELLSDIPLSEDIKETLILNTGVLSDIFNLVIAYEKCNWDRIDELTAKINISENYVIESYLNATSWCNEILKESLIIID